MWSEEDTLEKKETFEYFIGRIQNFSTKRLWAFEGNQTLVEAFDSFLNAVFRKCRRVLVCFFFFELTTWRSQDVVTDDEFSNIELLFLSHAV